MTPYQEERISDIPEAVSSWMAAKGQQGGLSKSERKRYTAKRNVAKARAAKAAKRLRPVDFVRKRAFDDWGGMTSVEALRAAQEQERAAEGEAEGLRIQQTGRRR